MEKIYCRKIETSWGRFFAAASPSGICRIDLPGQTADSFVEWLQKKYPSAEIIPSPDPVLIRLEKQLVNYFERQLTQFDLPLSLAGTPFQQSVWQELLKIPYGETLSYIELARRLGNPLSVRAVGTANGANPLPIVIPCHRVIGAGGKLIGYGGGLEMKQKLLQLESPQSVLSFPAQ
jgi:O-6-methylguanine DNA methyltransferase